MPKYSVALDQGTTSSRAMVFDHSGHVVAVSQKEHEQIYPKPGWVEHDPMEVWARCQEVIDEAVEKAGASRDDVAALGITNQRETAVVWDRNTGEPVMNAIVWQDTRTDKLVDELSADGGQDRFRSKVGLPLATYFSGPKVRWILDNVDGARARAEAGDLVFGNMDTWCIWNLTGGPKGGLHITDVTNASRTMLMDLKTLAWDKDIAATIGVPMSMLPEIKASSEVYGEVTTGNLTGVQVAGDLGDQQAATFGQACFDAGDAKNTYGTGNFMLLNTSTEAVQSKAGLLTTVCYKIGDEAAVYALEGSIAITGALVQWLRDNLHMIEAAPQVEELAKSVDDNGGLYIVPAFSGLFAPYWKSSARGVFAGLTRYVNAGHIARATLEATAFQTREVMDAMESDSGVTLNELKVDGGMVQNDLLMQFQADILGVPVIRPEVAETTALGASYAAGHGCRVLEQHAGGPRQLGRGQALGAQDGRRQARRVLQGVEEGRHPDIRLGRLGQLKGRETLKAVPRRAAFDGIGSHMASLSTDVLVIGGGATGAGVAWDAALRGYDVVVVDRADLAEGTSGRFHGLLHSGGRYAVKDPRAAEECIGENRILKRIAADCDRGHRRVLRHHAVGRPRVRRHIREGVPRHRRRLRGDRSGAGASRGAAAEPGHLARVPRPRRQHRRVEDRVGDGPRDPGARRAGAALPRGGRRSIAAATRSPERGCAARHRARRSTSRPG